MAIQYALLSLGTGVISSSQVHDMFHTVHIYMYRVFMHKCIAQLQPSGRARVCIYVYIRVYRYARRHIYRIYIYISVIAF